jgi:acyl-CoA-binding protein
MARLYPERGQSCIGRHAGTVRDRPCRRARTEGFFGFSAANGAARRLSSHFYAHSLPGDTMSDLQARFDQALIDVKTLSERPNNMTLLRLYALYKQGAEGDAHGDKPGMTDFVGRYKFEAWEALKGTSQDDAKQKYVELVGELLAGTAS